MAVIEHTGDMRPVPPHTPVRVWLINEGMARVGRADEFCWRTLDDPVNDIRHGDYRILRYEILDEETLPPPGPFERIFGNLMPPAPPVGPLQSAFKPILDPFTNPLAEAVAASVAADSAPGLLQAAAKHMADRAATYDRPEGERSMATTVKVFMLLTGRELRESEGWLLMEILKLVRSEQRAAPHRDSIEDNVAYAALYGEARLGGR